MNISQLPVMNTPPFDEVYCERSRTVNSIHEALNNVQVIIAEWFETAGEPGRAIPEPKGKLMSA